MLRWMMALACAVVVVLGVVMLGVGQAGAATVVYFGEDANANLPGASWANANAAHDAFLNALSNPLTDDFESATVAAGNFNRTMGGVNLAYSGGSLSIADVPASGRFAVSGSKYVTSQVTGGGMVVTLTDSLGQPSLQTALGFYATDVADFTSGYGLMTIQLYDELGQPLFEHALTIPQVLGADYPSERNGSILYYGLIVDPENAFASFSFGKQNTAGNDFWGLDDLTLGTPVQVPEPGTLALLSVVGIVGILKFRKDFCTKKLDNVPRFTV